MKNFNLLPRSKVITLGILTLVNIAIVGNLQPVATCALNGYALISYYAIALVSFFIPCIFITAHLATAFPRTGAAYHWIQKAFGKKLGFIGVSLLWFSNILWYPSIYSFIAAGIAYLFDPALAQSKTYMLATVLILFWSTTLLNILGIRLSSLTSSIAGLLGIVFPALLIIICAILWVLWDQPRQIHFSLVTMLPDFKQNENLGFLIAVLTSLFGIEMTAAHAENVIEPQKNFPRALFISGTAALIIMLGASLSIAILIPKAKISLVSGLLDAFILFFQKTPLVDFTSFIIIFVLLGNLGSIMAWMLSSTRSMQEACQQLALHPVLQVTNNKEAPVSLLLLETIIFTLFSGIYLLMPSVNQSYWFLLDLASQISLIYYALLFLAALWLYRQSHLVEHAWPIPGGIIGMMACVVLGVASAIFAIGFGFIPPSNLNPFLHYEFEALLALGIIIAIALPFAFLHFTKSSNPTKTSRV